MDCKSLASMEELLTVLRKMLRCKLHVSPFGYIHFHTSVSTQCLPKLFYCFFSGNLCYVGEMVLCSQQMTLLAKCKQSDLCCMQEQEDASSFIQSWKTIDSLLPHDWVGGNCCRYSFKTRTSLIPEKKLFISIYIHLSGTCLVGTKLWLNRAYCDFCITTWSFSI